jgi:hypothetical protein
MSFFPQCGEPREYARRTESTCILRDRMRAPSGAHVNNAHFLLKIHMCCRSRVMLDVA